MEIQFLRIFEGYGLAIIRFLWIPIVALYSCILEILSAWFISDTSAKFLLLSKEGMAQDVALLCLHQILTKIKGFVPG